MGRSPCCSKEGLNRGAWTALEDKILTAYIKAHGEGKWRNLPKRAGLKRCGKSCRLRWLNYLRPDIKRGNISRDEEELIIRLHNLLGNRWSLIAGRLPGRTDNEIKNYWNTTLVKKVKPQPSSSTGKTRPKKTPLEPRTRKPPSPQKTETKTQVIRTKATRCTRVLVPLQPARPDEETDTNILTPPDPPEFQNHHQTYSGDQPHQVHGEWLAPTYEGVSEFLNFDCNIDQIGEAHGDSDLNKDLTLYPVQSPSPPLEDSTFKSWTTNNTCLEDNVAMDLDSLVFLLDCGEWP